MSACCPCTCPRPHGKRVHHIGCPARRLFSPEEVIQIANETSDSLGNLYRVDFIDRINGEADR